MFLNPTQNKINGQAFGTLVNGVWTPSPITLDGTLINMGGTGSTPNQSLESAISGLQSQTVTLGGQYKTLSGTVNTLDGKIDGVATEVSTLQQTFNEDFKTLDDEVKDLEEKYQLLLDDEGLDDTINSFKEIRDYIATHGTQTANMLTAIQTNASNITIVDKKAIANAKEIGNINTRITGLNGTNLKIDTSTGAKTIKQAIADVDSANSQQIQEVQQELMDLIATHHQVFYATSEPTSGVQEGDLLIQYTAA